MKIAIYSRKSKFTGKGESIGNQIALCRDYIRTHIPEASEEDISVFEDEGFSAKNLDRPQFQLMMRQAKSSPFNYIVVYRLDRISRSVGDFAGLIEQLNSMGTAFICIKEQFDTSTPMGRAMMNIAAVFAQLERETIAERIHDNIILLARTGRWLGGVTPLGFRGEKTEIRDSEGKIRSAFRLTQVPEEIKKVRIIYGKFAELRSLTKTAEWLVKNGILTREGNEFRPRTVKDILTNPVYCAADEKALDYFQGLRCDICFTREEADDSRGIMPFGRTNQNGRKTRRTSPSEWILAIGKHKAVIPSENWINVQRLIGRNADKTFYRPGRNRLSLLSGLVRCGNCGHIMRPRSNSHRYDLPDGTRTFTYMCEYKELTHCDKCHIRNINGNALDDAVCKKILELAVPDSAVVKKLSVLTEKQRRESSGSAKEITLLNRRISADEKMISNLMQNLACSADNNSAIYRYTKQEVERLDAEITELRKQLRSIDSVEEKRKIPALSHKELVSFPKNFPVIFGGLSIEQKQNYLHSVIDKIIWDGETAHIYLKNE